MKRIVALLGILILLGGLSACGSTQGAMCGNGYMDAYYTRTDAEHDAALAAEQKAAQAQMEYEARLAQAKAEAEAKAAYQKELAERQKASAQYRAEKTPVSPPKAQVAANTVRGPEEFSSYAEYREYIDGLNQRERVSTNQRDANREYQDQKPQVVNNYYLGNGRTYEFPNRVYVAEVSPWGYSPTYSLWLDLDPWYYTTYRIRYRQYWEGYDPFWDAPYYDPYYPYPYSPSYRWSRWWGPYGWDSYRNGAYYAGYRHGYYDGYYWGGASYYPSYPVAPAQREKVYYGRQQSMNSMHGYGQYQRTAHTHRGATTYHENGGYTRVRGDYTNGGETYRPRNTPRYRGGNYSSESSSTNSNPQRTTVEPQKTTQPARSRSTSERTRNEEPRSRSSHPSRWDRRSSGSDYSSSSSNSRSSNSSSNSSTRSSNTHRHR